MEAKVTGDNAVEVSVAMTEALDRVLSRHLDKGPRQEDLTFAYWKPSSGSKRFTAVLRDAVLPGPGDRELQGNVAFTEQYARRVVMGVPIGCGIALLHSHLGPGWQGMSDDDIVAERERLAGACWGRTGLPLLGLTRGTDGTWSARIWRRVGPGPHDFRRIDAVTVRVVGHRLRLSYNDRLDNDPGVHASQVASASVWGKAAQGEIARTHIGIVGLGSVGSIVAEALARTGVRRVTFIDHDRIETRNLDRTLGAETADVAARTEKVRVAERNFLKGATANGPKLNVVRHSLNADSGWNAALDCDALFSCVDRPLPRHLLNVLAYSHLIPVVDGGIFAKVDDAGELLHIDWRIHRVGPEQQCLFCLGALLRSEVAMDRDGILDDPDYIRNLSPAEREQYAGRNVFAFSLSVAAHEVIQLLGMLTGQARVGGSKPQFYHAYPGQMDVLSVGTCEHDCEICALTADPIDPRVSKDLRAA